MWNDKETDVDLLGHDKIAQTILEIINDNHLRPLTIGVYGDWGVGKSSILSLLQAKVLLEKQASVSKIHCILFNGWLFQDYEDAKTALMETVVTELARLQPRNEKIQKLAKSLFKRINWLKVAKVSAAAAMTFVTGLPATTLLGQMGGWINKGKELIGCKEGKESATDEESFLKEEEEESVTQQIEAFRKEFKKLIQTSKVDHIIILVDDLDRCLPKSVIEILEAIRLFLFVEGTTFVLSADEKMIEYAVREHFPNLPSDYQEYTKNYLEKLIQIPIRIPLLNKTQTGNYIKLLMLQHHLKHNYVQLKSVYEYYNKQKKRPYDAVDLSYEIISAAIGSDATELKETLLVADQLTPTLASGLKGNPRNIKRFMNTLFLRMRIARIYGLEEIVRMNVLAKLMLLERFQSKRFDALVDEVTTTINGISLTIEALEKKKFEGKEASTEGTKTPDKEDVTFREWLSLEPVITSVDLRPYIFISKEKAIGFDASSLFPENLQKIYEMLNSHSDLGLLSAEKQLADISTKERVMLFDKLESESRSSTDLKNIPDPINGLLRIIKIEKSLEERFVGLLVSFPPSELGPWVVTELSGIKTEGAKEKVKALFKTFEGQEQNRTLKAVAKQALK
ncbi:Qat anti-phage system ATPase QatA [Limnovirga soli]|uniref:KAP NTPase domain-containing protein n=1 Tax=Limnovirga soli TaxID=2656915 RepID=A0A8J8JSQ5_9BACT|nr:Qat anti-phage system ATPase QatA [Limnovirga soli]NNV55008.1 hypothetical protein [Limnovirga soli]